MHNLPNDMALGAQKRGAQYSCIGCIGLRQDLARTFMVMVMVYCFI